MQHAISILCYRAHSRSGHALREFLSDRNHPRVP